MPVTTIYRQHRSITRPSDGWCAIAWTEYGWTAGPREDRLSDTGFWLWRSDPEAIALKVPPGELRRDAETAYRLACRGEQGFRLVMEDDMAKRRNGGPTLFGDLTDCGETAHWPDERPGPCGLPASGDGRAERLEDAIRRALAQLVAALDGDEMGRCVTARAILEVALEGAERKVG